MIHPKNLNAASHIGNSLVYVAGSSAASYVGTVRLAHGATRKDRHLPSEVLDFARGDCGHRRVGVLCLC